MNEHHVSTGRVSYSTRAQPWGIQKPLQEHMTTEKEFTPLVWYDCDSDKLYNDNTTSTFVPKMFPSPKPSPAQMYNNSYALLAAMDRDRPAMFDHPVDHGPVVAPSHPSFGLF